MDAADTAEAEAGVAAMGIGAKAAEGGDGTGTPAAERPPAHVADGGEPDAIPETPRPGGAEQEPVARARARALRCCAPSLVCGACGLMRGVGWSAAARGGGGRAGAGA